ncbi:hypothetical protein KUTeg_024448 [Tegillarca granosa]|uniref:PurE domain-containing protein n=1 Tax=Tegillarca granosa TaxID=220873 RepID=A0ABQ9E1Z7_TEGGR|nr:hypothetical protein KUTeg_024448 [Tegillarca granosa]
MSDKGIKTHFVKQHSDTAFIANRCEMIPIEWVTRRIATGSFLRRNPGVKEGYRFCPPKLETFFKDDENHDPQWSYEQCVAAQLTCGGVLIGPDELDIMGKTTVTVFEILERSWAALDCSLIDMKIEFGINPTTGEILLADVIDSDSWRLWPAGDRRLMKDKQVYRELKEHLSPKPHARAVVLMGSASDMAHSEKIKSSCTTYGVPCELRVTSAHKGTDETLKILAEYEGLGCSTVMFPEGAGLCAAQTLAMSDHVIWSKIRAKQLNTWIGLIHADKKARNDK